MLRPIYFYDFGKAAFAVLELELAGTPGSVVEVAIGEAVKNGRVDREPGGFCCFKSAEITLNSAHGAYTLEIPRHTPPKYAMFCMASPCREEIAPFRYAEVVGDCTVTRITRREIFPQWDDNVSGFTSSDADLNRIWEFCKYSIKATAAFGVFIDGERERCPYEGDTYINQLGWFCCSRDPEIPRRTIEFFKTHHTWPIEWSLLMPVIVRDYILYTGDESILPEMRENLESRLFGQLADADGMISGNDEFRELIDWPKGERDGYESNGKSLVPNCLRVMALNVMQELTAEAHYGAAADKLKSVIRKTMFKNGSFTDAPESSHTAQHSMFFPVAAGVAEPGEIAGLDKLDIKCSVYAVQFLLDALYMGNHGRRALELLVSKDLRSWQHMLELGATITLEAWDQSLKPNLDWNHAWGAAPANIIPRRLCGVRPLTAGFRNFAFDPQPGGLEYFKSKHPTPVGEISVEYEKGRFSVKMPENCRAFWNGKNFSGAFSGELS